MIFFKHSLVTFLIIFILNGNLAVANINDFDAKLSRLTHETDHELTLKKANKLFSLPRISPSQKASVLNVRGKAHFSLGNFKNALSDFKKFQKITHDQQIVDQEALAYKMVGIMHYYLGNHDEALSAYQSSLSFYQPDLEPIKHANLLSNIGLVYAATGDVSEAIKMYEQAETIYQEKGTEKDQVDIRHNIASLYVRLKRFDVAIEILKKVISARKSYSDEKGLALAYGDLGATYEDSGQYELAKKYLFKSLNYYKIQGDLYNSASQLHNLAELFNRLELSDKALDYAKQAVELSLAQGHKSAYAGSLFSYAKALFYKSQFDEALQALEKSTQIANKLSYEEQISENLALLSLIKAAQGDTQNAIKNHHLYIEENNKSSNIALNQEFARFEAQKLKQQVMQLEQSKKLQQLEMDQVTQKRNFIIVAIFLLFFILFFIFRRNIERNSKLTLEVQVKQRTQELECLMQELQQANNVKSQFLANMSHEIRTPLTAIIGQAEAIVLGDVEQEFICKEVSIIHNNSLHLLELINDILDLSKIEANKLELELQHQDLNIILEELNNIFKKQAKSKGLIFEIIHSLSNPFIINVDSFRLKQILINLCSNAIKFTSNGSVSLEISVVNDELIFKVVDTGIGMDDVQLELLFESFTQGDTSISRRFGGTGLGLCLSEQLAKIMNGEISVQSEVYKGSVFTLFLPFDQKSNDIYLPYESSELESKQVNTSFCGQVLLAEDHDDNRRLIARLLTSLGAEVVCAKNGKEAVELFLQHDPTLILLDIQMPEMDGIEAFTLLRQCGCSQPIIALTANAMSHEIEQYLSIGFDGHLKKPIERNIFIELVAQYCDSQNGLNEAYQAMNMLDMSDLITDFKNSLIVEKNNLVQAIKENDLYTIEQQAHKLAGAAQMFGFKVLSEYAKRLESHLKNNGVDVIDIHADGLLNELNMIILQE
ncbi:hypothetical protein CJF42_22225 [Pseudoalteromonas sp. NBT06-2]|uniref:tetratricopeptide repeat protein n=1 Tax=Pseudoalteromonas sp. NBT06-2 TaxID=2025950 RepID=UPI000BA50A60|nr:tetratricopeptide repeat protein [Pseudoalteromonas sp. NBT06-2]PAJ72247.1 hypothetical protein CJF42_22225 [Pseudoalteromonas sp. NBT06-2]